jgi:hypothetical protein
MGQKGYATGVAKKSVHKFKLEKFKDKYNNRVDERKENIS